MKPLRMALEAAGWSRYSPIQFLFFVFAASILLASWVQLSFEVLGLTIFSCLATFGLSIEALRFRSKQRSDQLARLWPEVLDSGAFPEAGQVRRDRACRRRNKRSGYIFWRGDQADSV